MACSVYWKELQKNCTCPNSDSCIMVLIGETERTRKLEVKQLHILSDVLWVIISIMYNVQFEGIKQVLYGKHTE